MGNFIEVPAERIETFLAGKGFTRSVQRQEVVYSRVHQGDPNVKILVYTSIRIGRQSARGNGQDSIKVCTIFDNGSRSFGIGKFPHVFRVTSVESVLERMYEKMRAAYARGSEWIAQNRPMGQNRVPSPSPRPSPPPSRLGPGGWDMTAGKPAPAPESPAPSLTEEQSMVDSFSEEAEMMQIEAYGDRAQTIVDELAKAAARSRMESCPDGCCP